MKLSPDAFWRLSLAEWRWLFADAFGPYQDRFTRDALLKLAAQYPDEKS